MKTQTEKEIIEEVLGNMTNLEKAQIRKEIKLKQAQQFAEKLIKAIKEDIERLYCGRGIGLRVQQGIIKRVQQGIIKILDEAIK